MSLGLTEFIQSEAAHSSLPHVDIYIVVDSCNKVGKYYFAFCTHPEPQKERYNVSIDWSRHERRLCILRKQSSIRAKYGTGVG